jgi:hypothetical protein
MLNGLSSKKESFMLEALIATMMLMLVAILLNLLIRSLAECTCRVEDFLFLGIIS